ncbi:MAG: T9SS type A sorting domain-containing protein [Ignavibacteria bacterium]|jgi:hypothetical protein|nr:T9SS type A sorting domain-containing protein [Ignavibacteria bacterium]
MEKKKTKIGLIIALLFLIATAISPQLFAAAKWYKADAGDTYLWIEDGNAGSGYSDISAADPAGSPVTGSTIIIDALGADFAASGAGKLNLTAGANYNFVIRNTAATVTLPTLASWGNLSFTTSIATAITAATAATIGDVTIVSTVTNNDGGVTFAAANATAVGAVSITNGGADATDDPTISATFEAATTIGNITIAGVNPGAVTVEQKTASLVGTSSISITGRTGIVDTVKLNFATAEDGTTNPKITSLSGGLALTISGSEVGDTVTISSATGYNGKLINSGSTKINSNIALALGSKTDGDFIVAPNNTVTLNGDVEFVTGQKVLATGATINVAGTAVATFAGEDGDTVNIGTLNIGKNATAKFTKKILKGEVNIASFLPTYAARGKIVPGQEAIFLDGTSDDLDKYDSIRCIDTVLVKEDKELDSAVNCYIVKIADNKVLDPAGKLTLNGTTIFGANSILAGGITYDGTWKVIGDPATYTFPQVTSLPDFIHYGILLTTQPADLSGYLATSNNGGKMPLIEFGAGATGINLNMPSNITEVGKLWARNGGSFTFTANGNLTTGAITLKNASNLRIRNSQPQGATITTKAGSPSVNLSNNSQLTVDTTSWTIADRTSIASGSKLTINIGNYTNLIQFGDTVFVGADTVGTNAGADPGTTLPGTLQINGTGRAAAGSANSVEFNGPVYLDNFYNADIPGMSGTSSPKAGTLNILTSKAKFASKVNMPQHTGKLATANMGIMNLTGTENHFYDTVNFAIILNPAAAGADTTITVTTDKNTSLYFHTRGLLVATPETPYVQNTFPATPATFRDLGTVAFVDTATTTTGAVSLAPIAGTVNIFGDFLVNKDATIRFGDTLGTGMPHSAAAVWNKRADSITKITVYGLFNMNGSEPTRTTKGAYTGTTLADTLVFVLNGPIGIGTSNIDPYDSVAAWGVWNKLVATADQPTNLTIGGNGQICSPFPPVADSVTFTNFTMNRERAYFNPGNVATAPLVILNDLTISAGALQMANYYVTGDDVGLLPGPIPTATSNAAGVAYVKTDVPLIVRGNATVQINGILDLGIKGTTAAQMFDTVAGTLINNGLIIADGKLDETNPTDITDRVTTTLTIGTAGATPATTAVGDYSGQGSLKTNYATNLNFHLNNSRNFPASVREADSVTIGIRSDNTLTMSNDLHAYDIINTSGELQVAGRTIILDSATLTTDGDHTGIINLGNNATLDITAADGGGVMASATDVWLVADGTSNLIIRKGTWATDSYTDPKTGTAAIPALNNLTISNSRGDARYLLPTIANNNSSAFAFTVNNINLIADTANPGVVNGIAGLSLTGGNAGGPYNNVTINGDFNVLGRYGTLGLDATDVEFTFNGLFNIASESTLTGVSVGLERGFWTIAGTASQFQIPVFENGAWASLNSPMEIRKITLNRATGARIVQVLPAHTDANHIATASLRLGHVDYSDVAHKTEVLNLQNGKLDLNGNNIILKGAYSIISEAAGSTVTNFGTSHFAKEPDKTIGAIMSSADLYVDPTIPSKEQLKSIGVIIPDDYTLEASDTVRRYPKSVTIPNVGRSTRRYYYINNATRTAAQGGFSSIGFLYDNKEVVSNESGLKVYLEKVDAAGSGMTTDAFSNAEELLGQTQVTVSSGYSVGQVMVSKFKDGSIYHLEAALERNAFIYALASLPGGGGMKVWTNGKGDDLWQTTGNWTEVDGDGGKAPGVLDQAIIARASDNIYITGTATCGDLFIDGDDIRLHGRVVNAGDKPTLQVTGNINVEGLSEIIGVEGNSFLNLNVGDGIHQGVTTEVSARYVDDNNPNTYGVWFNDITINTASFLPNNGIRVSGNINLIANSTITQNAGQDIILYGPSTTAKAFTMSMSSAAQFGNIILQNRANMTTAASFDVLGGFIFQDLSGAAASQWTSTGGTINFPTARQILWDNKGNAPLTFNNININGKDTCEPIGTATFRGELNVSGTGTALKPLATPYTTGQNGEYAIIFNNTSGQTSIVNQQTSDIFFHNLVVKPNTKLNTSSSFNIRNYLEVGTNATMQCDGGTVTYDGTDIMRIVNTSDHTLVHNNITVRGRLTTASSWKIAGDMLVSALGPFTAPTTDGGVDNRFTQTAGTITILNSQTRYMTDSVGELSDPRITFNKLLIADGSTLVPGGTVANYDGLNAAPASFEIKNYGANGAMESGIEVEGTGKFSQPATGIVYFSTDGTYIPTTDTNSKWIINGADKSSNLTFGNIWITGGLSANAVKTTSSFDIIGTVPASNTTLSDYAFKAFGAGASFTATDGIVNFNAATGISQVSSLSPATTQFYGVRSNNAVTVQFNPGDEFFIAGDMIADATSKFVAPAGTSTASNARVQLNGTTAQYLTGTSTAEPPFTFSYLQIDKGVDASYLEDPYVDNKGVVYLQRNVSITGGSAANPDVLILTSGVLNLGLDTLRVGARYITRHEGAIDGSQGTYSIEAEHQSPKIEDAFFTVGGKPTLWNLIVNNDAIAANDLTVNNDMTLANGIFQLAPAVTSGVIEPKLLTIYGDLVQSNPDSKLQAGSGDNTLSRLVLKGEGEVVGGLKDGLFNDPSTTDGTSGVFSITVGRGETLGGNLTMDKSNLTIQTGVNTLALNGNTLTLADDPLEVGSVGPNNPTGVTIVSGNITADNASTVNFQANDIIPANIFAKSEAGTVILTGTCQIVELRGDITINTRLTVGPGNRIRTGNNILTLADGSANNLGPLTTGDCTDKYVIGNLVRTVTNVELLRFDVGSDRDAGSAGTYYTPAYIQFASTGSSQQMMVTAKDVDPTAGRGGNPENSQNVTWTITPINGNVKDSLILKLGTTGLTPTPVSGKIFAAKWGGSTWISYANTINQLANNENSHPKSTVGTALNRYPVLNSDALAGDWGLFNADNAADALNTTKNKLVITSITPQPVIDGITFKMTVALQDQYGQPVVATSDVNLGVGFHNGTTGTSNTALAIEGSTAGLIPTGKSETTMQIQPKGSSPIAQLIVNALTPQDTLWTPAISDYFAILPSAPSQQAKNIVFSRVTYTSATAKWHDGDGNGVIIIAKAGGLLEANEMPVNGTTYVPNQVYGAGSNIGNAVVLYNGQVTQPINDDEQGTIDIYGLLPNTNYYIYAFAYNGDKGNESYKITAATRNPNILTTLAGNDDDITLGSNNTTGTSATVGTNAPLYGMIYGEGDVDNFNFMITSAAPNLRVLLQNLPGNYTLELYDFTGRRIRRSTLISNVDEALVVNNLPAGTYVVRVFSEDGSFWQREGDEYRLLINTYTNEIFSVTPTP